MNLGEPAAEGLVNSAMELAPHDTEITALVKASMAQVEAFFADCLSRHEPPPADIATTAKVLQGLMVGLMVMTRVNRDSPSVPAILAQVRGLVG